MQTQSGIGVSELKLRKLGNHLRRVGWLSFFIQFMLAIATGLALISAIQSPDLNEATTPGIAIGVFWALCGLIVLLGGVYLAFGLTRFGRSNKRANSSGSTMLQLAKPEIVKALRTGVTVGLVGMLLMILGEGVTLMALLLKAIAQPSPRDIYDVNELIRSLDIMVALSNISGIAAHFTGTVTSLSLLNWIQRQ